MNTYSPEMYNEILEFENFRYGKFLEIPYPTNNNHLQFNDAELQFNAELLAQQRFEDMCQ